MAGNSIYVTDERNDADLLKALGSIAQSYPLVAGDVNFKGKWIDNEEIWIWCERKKLGDLVACALDTGRLLRQIQEAHQAGFKFFFLIVEAMFRKDPATGLLQQLRGKNWANYTLGSNTKTIPYSRISGYLNQLRYYLNIQVYITRSVRETADTVMEVYSMFQTPPEDHNSLKQFATTPEPVASFLQKPSLIRRMAKELPGIGWDRSKDIEEELGSARELCRVLADGDREALLNIAGIGKGIVDKIQVELEENECPGNNTN